MFQYLNHRFHWNNISFQIPDGFYLDSDPEMPDKNTIWLVSPNLDFHISITILNGGEDTRTVLSDSITDMMPKSVSPIAPISINGLHGHHASFRLTRSRYYEILLALNCDALLDIVMWSTDDSLYDQTAATIAVLDFQRE